MWPIATSPGSAASFSSSNTCGTRPISRTAVTRPPSETAIPADSWPRCCSAKRPKYVRRATSRSSERTPNTPHIRRRPRGRARARRGGRRGRGRRRPSRCAGRRPRRPVGSGSTCPRRDRDDRPGRRPRRRASAGRRRGRASAPTPLQSAASASATARPPSETSWTSEADGATARRPHERHLGHEVERRRAPRRAPARLRLGARERQRRARSSEQDRVTLLPAARDAADVRDEADAADDRRRRDRAAVGVVVERHVPGDDRDAERLAGERHPLDRLGELPADLRLLRVAEVEAVGERERLAADARDVARRLENGELAADARVERADAAWPSSVTARPR